MPTYIFAEETWVIATFAVGSPCQYRSLDDLLETSGLAAADLEEVTPSRAWRSSPRD